MTVIKKLATAQSRSEPGVRFHCDICGSDITSTVSSLVSCRCDVDDNAALLRHLKP
jgi:hypothetical protein